MFNLSVLRPDFLRNCERKLSLTEFGRSAAGSCLAKPTSAAMRCRGAHSRRRFKRKTVLAPLWHACFSDRNVSRGLAIQSGRASERYKSRSRLLNQSFAAASPSIQLNMKFSYAIAALIATAASVQAVETNGERMARGLKPLPPRNLHRRASRTTNEARGATPSGTPSGSDYNCNTGSVQCCNQVSKANDTVISTILGLLGIGGVADDILVGLKCSPLSVVGLGSGNSCSQRPVCCENNSKGGLISIGCIPITL